MKKILAALVLILATGCDDKQLIIVKDGAFDRTAFLSNNGIVVHHLGMNTLKVQNAKAYIGAINNMDAITVIIDLGRTDETNGTKLEKFKADFSDLMSQLTPYEDREFICVQRSQVFTPPCATVIQPNELPGLFQSIIDRANAG